MSAVKAQIIVAMTLFVQTLLGLSIALVMLVTKEMELHARVCIFKIMVMIILYLS